jgi:hypothetical protein
MVSAIAALDTMANVAPAANFVAPAKAGAQFLGMESSRLASIFLSP